MLPCLLDTNILLTATIAPERLLPQTQALLCDPGVQVFFSAASIWEIAIKYSLNRTSFDFLPQDIHSLALDTGFTEMAITAEHTHAVATMPWHHRDPFDRLLIAQAVHYPAQFYTTDRILSQYSDRITLITLR